VKKIVLPLLILSTGSYAGAQNVGIGTSNPGRAKLEVHGVIGSSFTSAMFGGDSTGLSFQQATPTIGFNQYHDGYGSRYINNGYAAVQYIDNITGAMTFDMFSPGTANGFTQARKRALTLSIFGHVAIGSSIHNSALSVSRNPGVEATAWFFGTAHPSAFNFGPQENTHIRAGKDGSTVVVNDVTGGKIIISGAVGINSNSPVYPLEVKKLNDRHMILVEPNTFNNWEWNVHSTSGNLQLIYNGVFKGMFDKSNGEYHSVSDRRLKTGIQALPSILSRVMKLEPVEYEMIQNNPEHEKSIGFIAQDVKVLFPELVTVKSDTAHGQKGIPGLHTLNYDGFGVLAIKAIQEQQEIIHRQQKSIAALRLKLETLKKMAAQFKLQ
jgi:hypothetical protein